MERKLNKLELSLWKEITKDDKKMKEYLIEEGYDKKFGARPLERLVQKKIKEPLADEILFGKLKNGGKVIVDFSKEKLEIKISK